MEFDDDPRTKQDYQDAISELKDLESELFKIDKLMRDGGKLRYAEVRIKVAGILQKIRGEQ